jgi:hypothetical protein
MATVVGEKTQGARRNENHKRFSVKITVAGKPIPNFEASAGMLFSSAKAAEQWVIRTLHNCGFRLPKGAVVEATEVKER